MKRSNPLTPQKRKPDQTCLDHRKEQYCEFLTSTLERTGYVTWEALRARFRKEFGEQFDRRYELHNIRTWARNAHMHENSYGVALPWFHRQAERILSQNEKNMVMWEIRRHRIEIATFHAMQSHGFHFPFEAVQIVASMLPFRSKFKDYEIQKTTRSDTGLEKADGHLYEQHVAMHKETNIMVVMEVFHIEEDGTMPKFLLREMEMSKILYKHRNIWQIIDEIRMKDKIAICRHRVECTLSSVINTQGPLSTGLIKFYLQQLLNFLDACHQNGVICDGISSGSIMVDENHVLKITRNPANFYDPPERLLADTEEKRAKTHTEKKDVWSLGCVFAKLAKGAWLFDFGAGDESDFEVLLKIFQTLGKPSAETWGDAYRLNSFFNEIAHFPGNSFESLVPNLPADGIDLLRKMLILNPEDRISIFEALNHPFLNEVPVMAHIRGSFI